MEQHFNIEWWVALGVYVISSRLLVIWVVIYYDHLENEMCSYISFTNFFFFMEKNNKRKQRVKNEKKEKKLKTKDEQSQNWKKCCE